MQIFNTEGEVFNPRLQEGGTTCFFFYFKFEANESVGSCYQNRRVEYR